MVKTDVQLPISDLHDTPPMLENVEIEICTADPASFLVASAVTSKVRSSVRELKQIISRNKPELELVIDRVLSNMAKIGLIKIFEDKIVLLKPGTSYMDVRKSSTFDFLPKIFSTLCLQILKNAKANKLETGEQIQWFSLPNHPYIEKRIAEINRRYCQEMDQLTEWSEDHPECEGDKLRLTMIMSGNLNPEDF